LHWQHCSSMLQPQHLNQRPGISSLKYPALSSVEFDSTELEVSKLCQPLEVSNQHLLYQLTTALFCSRLSPDSISPPSFAPTSGSLMATLSLSQVKVHRGQLERHSDVFNDMFSIPQPTDQEMIDGCFWVELYDRPSDVFYFLRALYDGLYVPSRSMLSGG
jgi:hypothetical protein